MLCGLFKQSKCYNCESNAPVRNHSTTNGDFKIFKQFSSRADLVCHLPPTSILGTNFLADFYHHTQIEYWIKGDEGKDGKFADQSVYEDSTCSNSLGPLYSALDHLYYFDIHILECISDAQELLALPEILEPFGVVPPLPQIIHITLTDIGDKVLPILG